MFVALPSFLLGELANKISGYDIVLGFCVSVLFGFIIGSLILFTVRKYRTFDTIEQLENYLDL